MFWPVLNLQVRHRRNCHDGLRAAAPPAAAAATPGWGVVPSAAATTTTKFEHEQQRADFVGYERLPGGHEHAGREQRGLLVGHAGMDLIAGNDANGPRSIQSTWTRKSIFEYERKPLTELRFQSQPADLPLRPFGPLKPWSLRNWGHIE